MRTATLSRALEEQSRLVEELTAKLRTERVKLAVLIGQARAVAHDADSEPRLNDHCKSKS